MLCAAKKLEDLGERTEKLLSVNRWTHRRPSRTIDPVAVTSAPTQIPLQSCHRSHLFRLHLTASVLVLSDLLTHSTF
ncbi:hypothetical protein Ddye_030030 [Dipteronia dyeriana]|uniref:Uncharacterized protein n=1 Tax=Dipteronia dyeriana TaxID=168575 RepID=A0AAD9WMC2_9ROSI|nr:hypothetical protein Ddye_030030 [Dipteronia dyeriana]